MQLLSLVSGLARRPRWVLSLACALVILMAVVTALQRRPWPDEGWFSSAAYNLANHGYMGTTVVEPTYISAPRIDEHTYWIMPLYLVGQGLWYMVVPENLVTTRLFSLVWGLLALFCFHRICRHVFEERGLVLLSTALLAANYQFLDNVGYARPETMCMSLGLAALASYLSLRRRNLSQALAAATACISLSVLTHPNGILHFAGLLILVFWYDRPRLSWRHLIAAALPPIVAIGLWSIYILQDPEGFFAQLRGNAYGRNSAGWNLLLVIWNEISQRYFTAFGVTVPSMLARFKTLFLVSIAVATAAAWAIRELRVSRSVRLFLYLWAAYFAIQCVYNQKLSEYLVHITPWYCGLFAVWIAWLWGRGQRMRWLAVAWAAMMLLLQPAGIGVKSATRSFHQDMDPAIAFLTEQTADADLIFGSASLLFAVDYDPRLLDDPHLGTRSGRKAGAVVIEEVYDQLYTDWAVVRPDDHQRIMAELQNYQKVYDHAGYKVYLPRE